MSDTQVSGASSEWRPATAQYPFESVPEFRTENRVYYRIKGRIKIAQPEEYGEQVVAGRASFVHIANRQ